METHQSGVVSSRSHVLLQFQWRAHSDSRWPISGVSVKSVTLQQAASLLSPGTTAFIHGTATEPRILTDYLYAHPDALTKVHLVSSFIPGINTVNLAAVQPTLSQTNTMAQAAYADAHAAGQVDWLRHAYSRLPDYFKTMPKLDLAYLQCVRDSAGNIVTGISGELLPLAAELAETVCVLLNDQMPIPIESCVISPASIDFVCEVSKPLVQYPFANRVDATTERIADRVAELVNDGDTIQAGIGVIPGTVFERLRKRSDLRVYSGMISDATVDLAESGALASEVTHIYGMAMGTERLYQWLDQRAGFAVKRVEEAHCRATVRRADHFVAMNSALEVALDGSVNAEQIGARVVSGRGGLPDFAHGAAAAEHGRSIIAIPAANMKRGYSRIVGKLANHAAPTLPAGTVSHVVTEFGTAELLADDPVATAQQLIGVAHPDFRQALQTQLPY